MVLLLLKPACRLGIDKPLLGLLALLLLAGCSVKEETLPFYNTAEFTAQWIQPGDAGYKNIHTIDSFTLQNQQGHIITKDSLDGFIYVANFFLLPALVFVQRWRTTCNYYRIVLPQTHTLNWYLFP